MKDKGLLSRVYGLMKSAFGGSFSEALSRTHGQVGRLFGAVVDIFRTGGAATPDDIRRSAELMEQSGFASKGEPDPSLYEYETIVQVPNQNELSTPDQLEMIRFGNEIPPEGPIRLGPQEFGLKTPTFEVATVPTVGGIGSRRQKVQRDSLLKAMGVEDGSAGDIVGNLIQTPESSNVYGFNYDAESGILYVQYKAQTTPTHYTGQINQCNGKAYMMGHKAHIPGPLYAYGSRAKPVPQSVFNEMRKAMSKGEFVWQRLRVCGSLWEHQYTYQLVTPTFLSLGNGSFAAYTPRKSSSLGFRVRSVPSIGQGRRPFLVSNLPGYNNPRGLQ